METRCLLNQLIPKLIMLVIILSLLDTSDGCADSNVQSKHKTVTTVILIRHAERDNFFNITNQGRERANALVDAVKSIGVSAIYSPDLSRNLDTVKPLADYLKIDITLIPRINKSSIDEIIGEIFSNNTRKVVLLVGNGSGNLRLLNQQLGGSGDGPYQYGELYIYTIPDKGSVKIIKSKFGP